MEHRTCGLTLLLVLSYFGNVGSECLKCTGDCRGTTVDVTFVVDGSGSICENAEVNCQAWKNVLQFVANIVDHLNIGFNNDRVAFVQFSNEAYVEFGLVRYTTNKALQDAILRINHRGGNTNTSGGIRVMRKEVFFTGSDRLDVQNVAVVITDGISTRDPDLTIPEAEAARAAGVYIYSVGITSNVDVNEVEQISSPPQMQNINYWLLKTFDEASSYEVTDNMFNSVCNAAAGQLAVQQPTVSRCPGKVVGDDCYVIQEVSKTWSKAEEECTKLASIIGLPGGGSLVMPKTEALMSRLNTYIDTFRSTKIFSERERLSSFWVGGQEETQAFPVWRWLNGLTLLEDQGCFEDLSQAPDVGSTTTISGLTRGACKSRCYTYAYSAVQEGNKCACGNSYGRYGTAEGCIIPCEGSRNTTCGGTQKNQILLTGGVYGLWAYNQPNNYNGYQPCGSLERKSSGSWALNDLGCSQKLSYICRLPFSNCNSNTGTYQIIQSYCLHFVVTPKTWFSAREECLSQNGDLVSIDKSSLHFGIEKALNTILFMYSPFWVGAIGRLWGWKDGDAMTYTSWSPGEPNEISKNCLKLATDSSDKVWWKDESCDMALPYICHIDLTTPPAAVTIATPKPTAAGTLKNPSLTGNLAVNINFIDAPATTVAPQASQTSAMTTQTTTPTNGSEPDLGASTDEEREGVSSSYYFLIGFACLLILLVVMGIILLKIHIKTNNDSKEKGKNLVAPSLVEMEPKPVWSVPVKDAYHKVAPEIMEAQSPPDEVQPGAIEKPTLKKSARKLISHIHNEKPGVKIVNLVHETVKVHKAPKDKLQQPQEQKTLEQTPGTSRFKLAANAVKNFSEHPPADPNKEPSPDRPQNVYEEIYMQPTRQPMDPTPTEDIVLPVRKSTSRFKLAANAVKDFSALPNVEPKKDRKKKKTLQSTAKAALTLSRDQSQKYHHEVSMDGFSDE